MSASRRVPLFILLASCATAPPVTNQPPPKTKHPVFVATTGNDAATGSEATPFRTIERALEVLEGTPIVISGGEYADQGLRVARSVEIVGPSGNVLILGRVTIAANDVALRSVDLGHGLAIEGATGLVLDTVHVKNGGDPDALSVKGASLQLHDTDVACGPETCIAVSSSTISLTSVRLTGDANAKRGLKVDTSSVSALGLTVGGTSVNQILVGRGANVHLADLHLNDALGTALAAVDGAQLLVDRAGITGAARFGALVQTSRVQLRGSSFAAPNGIAVGITGGDVDIVDTTLETSSQGALTISAFSGKSSSVRINGGVVNHGSFSGVLLSQGDLTINGTRFSGDPSAAKDGGDAIAASSPDAMLSIRGAVIDAPAGFGVSFTNNASGSVTATITRPRLGGISIDGTAGTPIAIRSSHVEACRQGSGIVALDAMDVSIAGTSVSACPEAGVLGGQGAVLNVSNGIFANNTQYGIAAFGGAVIEVSRSRVKGSRWALFASCGDQARIDDGGGNLIQGQTTSCP